MHQYLSCLHSLYSCSITHITYISLSLPSNIINVISHLKISASFQFNRFGLENKQTEFIGFFAICLTKPIELEFFWIGRGEGVLWVAEQL